MFGDGAESVTLPIAVPDLIGDPAALPPLRCLRRGTWALACAGAARVGGASRERRERVGPGGIGGGQAQGGGDVF